MSPKILNRAKRLAITLASNNPYKYKVSAVGLYGSSIVGVGMSSPKTHPVQGGLMKRYSSKPEEALPTLHAEVDCLIRSIKPPDTVVIARTLKDGTLAISKPCIVCEAALKDAKVAKVIYINENKEWEEQDYDY